MKLKYRISRSFNLDKRIIVDRIQTELEKQDYRIFNVTENLIEFDDPWKLMWRSKADRRLNGGKFEINMVDNSSSVIFVYYLNLIQPIAISAVIIFSIIFFSESFYYAPIFCLFIFIFLIIRIESLESVARNILNDIAN